MGTFGEKFVNLMHSWLRPRFIRKDADAIAYKMKLLGKTAAEVRDENFVQVVHTGDEAVNIVTESDLAELRARAGARDELLRMQRQANVEAIGWHAAQE